MSNFWQLRSRPTRGLWRVTRWWLGDRRSALELSLLRLLAVAHGERLDVRPLVQNLATEFRGSARRRLRRLDRQLHMRLPLVDALEQTPELLRDEDLLSLRFASSAGTLPQTYQELIQRAESRGTGASDQVRQAFEYGLSLAFTFALIATFLMTFIVPTFRKMFDELGMRLPLSAASLFDISNVIARDLPLWLLVIATAAGLMWIVRPFRHLRRWMGSRLMRSTAQLQRSQLLRLLALAIDAGRPLSSSLSTLARYHFDRSTRLKLLVVCNDIEQGADTWQALEQSHLLLPSEAQSLTEASTPKLQTWIMRRVAQQQEEVVHYRRATVAMLFHPLIVLVFGAIVAWFAVACFSVLTSMITSLT